MDEWEKPPSSTAQHQSKTKVKNKKKKWHGWDLNPRTRGTRRLLIRKVMNLESGAFDRTSLPGQVTFAENNEQMKVVLRRIESVRFQFPFLPFPLPLPFLFCCFAHIKEYVRAPFPFCSDNYVLYGFSI